MTIPGYLVWAALLYASVGTWLAIRIGRPLIPLNFAQQRLEADFRFSLIRLRENAESVALYGGEPVEQHLLQGRFQGVFGNFIEIMKCQRRLTWFRLGYTQAAMLFSVVVVSPLYFARRIGLGGMMQVVNAFSFVQNALSFIINSYTDIAAWQAATERLAGFEEQLLAIHRSMCAPRDIVVMRFAVRNVRRQRRIEAAKDTGEVATLDPCPRAHARDRKIGDRDVTGLDVDEQRRGEHLRAHGAQERGLTDTGGADD